LVAAHPQVAVKALPNTVLMPGLVNAHAHSGFLRGTAEHLPVWDWLTLHINPMHRMLQPHEAEAASWLCYAESVLGGTTTVVDMWRYMDGSAKAAEAIGNRLVAVPYVGEHPDYDYFDTLDMNEALIEGSSTSSMPTTPRSGARWRWRSATAPVSTPTAARPRSSSPSSRSATASGRCSCSTISASSTRRAP
jgi:hypothetical protein